MAPGRLSAFAVLKGRRAQARTAILDLLQQQERYMTQNNAYYAFDNANGAITPPDAPFKTYAGDGPVATLYQLSAERCPSDQNLSDCIQITATPTFADTQAGSLWAQSLGARNCTGTAGTDPAPPPSVCWP